jgi:hypothetical protein
MSGVKNSVRVLVLLLVSGYFTVLTLGSAWHETGKCSGQGCLIVFPVAALWLGLGYALLLPAYFWMVSGRAPWSALLALAAVGLSFVVLRHYSLSFGGGLAWEYREEDWPVHYLLRREVATVLLMPLVLLGRLVWGWFTESEPEEAG